MRIVERMSAMRSPSPYGCTRVVRCVRLEMESATHVRGGEMEE